MDQFPDLKSHDRARRRLSAVLRRADDNEHRYGPLARISRASSRAICRASSMTPCCSPDMLEFPVPRCRRATSCSASDYPFAEKQPVEYVRRAKKIGKKEQDAILGSMAARLSDLDLVHDIAERHLMADVESCCIDTTLTANLHHRVRPRSHLWFCESGASKIGRLNPGNGSFVEFATPTPNSKPIGIIPEADRRALVLRERERPDRTHHHLRRDRRISRATRGAAPTASSPARWQRVVLRKAQVAAVGRITPHGEVTEFSKGLTPAAGRFPRWCATATSGSANTRRGNRPHHLDGQRDGIQIPTRIRNRCAMVTHPDGNIWFVQTKANGLGRIDGTPHHRMAVKTPDASLRGVTVAPTAISGSRRISPTRSPPWRPTAR